MEFKYLNIDDPLIEDIISLFEKDRVGGTSSLSLRRSQMGENSSIVLACVQNDLVIGAVEFSPTYDDVVRIGNIVVEEDYRKQGIATLLLEKVEERIASEYKPKTIKTIPMPYSYKIFEKFGYLPDRESEYDWFKLVNS
ncbi:GNAT family N-acetyltransferase [Microbulbifer variabilis]|uniref:GNAT family N-acetyltransferase n=1 Tax=Microbulbifer variabilis TaxID=266805 RepID=UPI00035DB2C6|nr:GNAT family N-acetyltransferase [Microbulbifer variabilis]